jgi:hypothetical protein
VTFLSTLALAVALLVVAPYLAHRLRRRRAEEQPFPPARLVPPSPPKARRRSRLEDRALFAARTASIVALAVLGATPFVRCSRLSLHRSSGASVAIVIVLDDSMSMRAPLRGGSTRFDRARQGARELLASAREGDAFAIVLGGAPARVALGATTDLRAARRALDALVQTDRATDLDGALVLARGLVTSLPQVDQRLVVLSDLADGHPDATPLGQGSPVPVWLALPDLIADGHDCAVLRGDRTGSRVRAAVACGSGASAAGREVTVEDAAGRVLGRAPVPAGSQSEISVTLTDKASEASRVRLTGTDAVGQDDVAPLIVDEGRGAVAVVADATDEAVATGGAPVVEQALAALRLAVDVRPIPGLPDRAEELAGVVGIVLDDPTGLTPEQRHTVEAFVGGGGLVLLALGPRAAAAPLGSTFEPILGQGVAWTDAGRAVPDPATAVAALLGSAASLEELGADRRATIAPADVAALEPLVKWTDGAPLVARRPLGRGEAWLVTLPFSVDASDLALRPAFLALLDAWVRAALEHAAPRRTEIGLPWKFPADARVEVRGPDGPVVPERDEGGWRVMPEVLGSYDLTSYGKTERRVVMADARELDLRPRAATPEATAETLGQRRGDVDVSAQVAILLLGLMAAEMGLRLYARRTSPA